MDDAELERLLSETESDRVERKASLSDPDKARQAICAFANDLPDHREAGVLFVGANDDGTPSGLPITDQLLLNLSAMKADGKIQPIPSLTVQKRRLRQSGIGIETARRELKNNGNPDPQFEVLNENVLVTVRRAA